MRNWPRALADAPSLLKLAMVCSGAELIVALVGVLGGIARQGFPTRASPAVTILGYVVGALVVAVIVLLPVDIALSRYPKRRYWAAIVFQSLLALVTIDYLIFRPSVTTAATGALVIVTIASLVSSPSRKFVSERERRFASLEGRSQRPVK